MKILVHILPKLCLPLTRLHGVTAHRITAWTIKPRKVTYIVMNHSFLTVPVGVEDGTSGSTYGVCVRSSWHAGASKHDDRVTWAVWQPSQTACAVWLRNTQWNMGQPRLLPFASHLPSRHSCQIHTCCQTYVTGCPLIGTICNFNSMLLLALFQFYKHVT